MFENKKEPSCAREVYFVQEKDLPLSCPTHDMVLWNAHPKVFLPIEQTGKEICPYCGSCFVLEDN